MEERTEGILTEANGLKRYYLAYGSNLNLEEMKKRCPGARVIGVTRIPDYRLLVKKGGSGAYLTIEKERGRSVPAAAWEVGTEEEAALDEYEGFPRLYCKTEERVSVKEQGTGKTWYVQAFVYRMYEKFPAGVPTEEYKRICLQGYRDFGFEERELLEAFDGNQPGGSGHEG